MAKKRVSVGLDEEVYKKLMHYCIDEDLRFSQFVSNLFDEALNSVIEGGLLKDYEEKKPRRKRPRKTTKRKPKPKPVDEEPDFEDEDEEGLDEIDD